MLSSIRRWRAERVRKRRVREIYAAIEARCQRYFLNGWSCISYAVNEDDWCALGFTGGNVVYQSNYGAVSLWCNTE